MKQKRITIKDVAEKAGVSTATVSHVINGTRFVQDETRSRVVNAMEDLNYYSSRHAKFLATGKTCTIGLVVSDISNPFFPQIIQGIEELAVDTGYDIMLFNTNYEVGSIKAAAKKFIEYRVDGVMVMTTEVEYGIIKMLNEKNIPLVFLDWGVTGNLVSDIKENFNSGIDEAVKCLVQLGHKNIALITGPLEFRTSVMRRNSFLDAVKKYDGNILKTEVIEADFKIDGGRKVFDQLYHSSNPPTAVLASNDLMAIGVMQQAKKYDVKIPEEMSVIGIDDIYFASYLDPALTSICIPREAIYRNAWKVMMDFLESDETMGKEIMVDTWLVKRDSTSRPGVKREEEKRDED